MPSGSQILLGWLRRCYPVWGRPRLKARPRPAGEYPKNAKSDHQRLGTFESEYCRANPDDVLEKYWALTDLVDRICEGTERYRRRLAAMPAVIGSTEAACHG